ncbi:MAG: thymidine kinase, partial [Deltaproteobacteria bacterium]|nr:thymidine kinase [Deltaproteobacteria bacterium]
MIQYFPLVRRGHIEVICGPMFSGKSEELIRRLRRVQLANQRLQIFKPVLDDRYDRTQIVSHSDMKIPAEVVRSAAEILERLDERADVVGIDEAQFFDAGIVPLCQRLANMGKRVIVAGLDQDWRGEPFDPMPQLMAVAEYVTKTLAVCVRCGAPASRSQRLAPSPERVQVGAAGMYEARCRHCYEPEVPPRLPLDEPGRG